MKREGAELVSTRDENIRERVERLASDFDGKLFCLAMYRKTKRLENCFKGNWPKH
jgi:hypothetical protein